MGNTEDGVLARLVLEDGGVFVGRGFGAVGRGVVRAAEVVFNTAMTGYQESMTDPSYSGQILVMTAPMIGNTGVNPWDVESGKVQIAGLVVRELTRRMSNYRATGDLSSYLADQGVLGISDVDTRAITRRLRVSGVMRGVITDDARRSDQELVSAARAAGSMEGMNLVPGVGCRSAGSWEETLGDWTPSGVGAGGDDGVGGGRKLRVAALDCGAKRNILRNLASRGCEVVVLPHDVSAGEVLGMVSRDGGGGIDGLFVSNGPGDPAAVEGVVRMLRDVMGSEAGRSLPIFGICLGHQLLSLAIGAKTYKLKFGHRGANQPVLNCLTGRVEITSQNHGFAVEPDSLKSAGGEVTHVNLNDGTVAGFCFGDRPVFAVQHHPEASPGPHDAGYLFDAFVLLMRGACGGRGGSVSARMALGVAVEGGVDRGTPVVCGG